MYLIFNSTGLIGLIGIKLLAILIIYYAFHYSCIFKTNSYVSSSVKCNNNKRVFTRKNIVSKKEIGTCNILVLFTPTKGITIGKQQFGSTKFDSALGVNPYLNDIYSMICDIVSTQMISGSGQHTESYTNSSGKFDVCVYITKTTAEHISFTIYIISKSEKSEKSSRVIYGYIIDPSYPYDSLNKGTIEVEDQMKTDLDTMGLNKLTYSDSSVRWHLNK